MQRNIISTIFSVILWAVVMLLTGVFGPVAFSIGLIILKIIGSIILLALFIRIPIVLMDKDDNRKLNKMRETINASARASLAEVADGVKRSTLNIAGRDHPVMPPDYDE